METSSAYGREDQSKLSDKANLQPFLNAKALK